MKKIASLEEELLRGQKGLAASGENDGTEATSEQSAGGEPALCPHRPNGTCDHRGSQLQLEDITKQRIRGEVWADAVVNQNLKRMHMNIKHLTLNREKSKLSLAETYEQEYIKFNQQNSTEEENPEFIEIREIMGSLFLKLDALSYFHFIPNLLVTEIKMMSSPLA